MMMGGKPKKIDGIAAEDVTVTYRNGHTALRHASFSVPKGTITALVGVNGAGKSTLFKAIMGFVPVAAGKVTILGLSVREALKKNLVAYVPQAEEVDWSFPVLVEDVVMMGRYGHMNWLRIPTKRDHEMVDQPAHPQMLVAPRGIGQVHAERRRGPMRQHGLKLAARDRVTGQEARQQGQARAANRGGHQRFCIGGPQQAAHRRRYRLLRHRVLERPGRGAAGAAVHQAVVLGQFVRVGQLAVLLPRRRHGLAHGILHALPDGQRVLLHPPARISGAGAQEQEGQTEGASAHAGCGRHEVHRLRVAHPARG